MRSEAPIPSIDRMVVLGLAFAVFSSMKASLEIAQILAVDAEFAVSEAAQAAQQQAAGKAAPSGQDPGSPLVPSGLII